MLVFHDEWFSVGKRSATWLTLPLMTLLIISISTVDTVRILLSLRKTQSLFVHHSIIATFLGLPPDLWSQVYTFQLEQYDTWQHYRCHCSLPLQVPIYSHPLLPGWPFIKPSPFVVNKSSWDFHSTVIILWLYTFPRDIENAKPRTNEATQSQSCDKCSSRCESKSLLLFKLLWATTRFDALIVSRNLRLSAASMIFFVTLHVLPKFLK